MIRVWPWIVRQRAIWWRVSLLPRSSVTVKGQAANQELSSAHTRAMQTLITSMAPVANMWMWCTDFIPTGSNEVDHFLLCFNMHRKQHSVHALLVCWLIGYKLRRIYCLEVVIMGFPYNASSSFKQLLSSFHAIIWLSSNAEGQYIEKKLHKCSLALTSALLSLCACGSYVCGSNVHPSRHTIQQNFVQSCQPTFWSFRAEFILVQICRERRTQSVHTVKWMLVQDLLVISYKGVAYKMVQQYPAKQYWTAICTWVIQCMGTKRTYNLDHIHTIHTHWVMIVQDPRPRSMPLSKHKPHRHAQNTCTSSPKKQLPKSFLKALLPYNFQKLTSRHSQTWLKQV